MSEMMVEYGTGREYAPVRGDKIAERVAHERGLQLARGAGWRSGLLAGRSLDELLRVYGAAQEMTWREAMEEDMRSGQAVVDAALALAAAALNLAAEWQRSVDESRRVGGGV